MVPRRTFVTATCSRADDPSSNGSPGVISSNKTPSGARHIMATVRAICRNRVSGERLQLSTARSDAMSKSCGRLPA